MNPQEADRLVRTIRSCLTSPHVPPVGDCESASIVDVLQRVATGLDKASKSMDALAESLRRRNEFESLVNEIYKQDS